MSKKAAPPDQTAIDLATMGAFISTACAVYIAELGVEEAYERSDKFLDDARDLADDLTGMVKKYGVLGPIALGRSDEDEKRYVKRYMRRVWGKGRRGGIL